MTMLLILAASGGLAANAGLLFMILAMLLFAICFFLYWGAPQPGPWYSRLFAGAFFFWTLAIVVNMFGGL